MKRSELLLSVIILLGIISCKSNSQFKETTSESLLQGQVAQNQTEDISNVIPTERKLIKKGEIVFQTNDVNKTKAFISLIVDSLGGYISKENMYDNTDKYTHRLEVRIPAYNFDQLINKISESTERLDSKSVDVLDVTEEYIDVESRIKTKKELENRYTGLLKQAKSVEDILSIEKEMGILRTEIESLEGRLRYLKDQVGYSTLTIEYYEKKNSSFDFLTKLGNALSTGWDWLLSFLIAILHIWPFIILIGGGLYVAYFLDKRKTIK